MNGLDATDRFFDVIAAELAPKLSAESLPLRSHWMIISDAQGVTTCRLDDETEGMAIDSVLASHIDGGAAAAAFVTVHKQSVLAQTLTTEPRNSDLRRAPLINVSGELQLGPWVSEL